MKLLLRQPADNRTCPSVTLSAPVVGNAYLAMSKPQLEAAEVPENHAARLLGHDLKTMSYGVYSEGVPCEVLQRAVECLDWRQR